MLPTNPPQDDAMSDRSAAVEVRDEEAGAANSRLPQNGDRASNGQQKLDLGAGAQQFAARTTTPIKKKAKRKDDGPLEIVCKWIVQYQVGMSSWPSPPAPPALDDGNSITDDQA